MWELSDRVGCFGFCARARADEMEGESWVAGFIVVPTFFLRFDLTRYQLFIQSQFSRSPVALLSCFTIYTFGWHRGSEPGTMDRRRRWFRHASASLHSRSTCTCDRTCRALSQSDFRSILCSRLLRRTGHWLRSLKLIHKLHHLRRRMEHSAVSWLELNRKATVCFPKLELHSRRTKETKKLVWVNFESRRFS